MRISNDELKTGFRDLMISSMVGLYGFGGEAVYCATKFAQVGFAQALDRELRLHGIKVGVICPGGVKTEFALGRGRTQEGVSNSDMLEPEAVAVVITIPPCGMSWSNTSNSVNPKNGI